MSCNNGNAQQGDEKKVVIKTTYGDMKIKLYNDTPKHRDNFIKLVEDGFYDSLIFHRVIDGFMIQGGDPQSKGAEAGKRLGNGGPGYKIDAEILDNRFHKKGALAAAREGDMVNPEKKSSGSQFYIVQGKTYKDQDFVAMEQRMNMGKEQQIFRTLIEDPKHEALKKELEEFQKNQDRAGFQKFITEKVKPLVDAELEKQGKFVFPEERKEIYKTLGGTPFLDGEYTVFGEVYEGFNVIDSIAKVKKDQFDRPEKDVLMQIEVIQ